MESYEFQAVGPRTKGAVVPRLPRKVSFDGERERAREEESGHGHERLKPFGALLPEVSIGFFISFQQVREDRLQMQYLVDVYTPSMQFLVRPQGIAV